MHKVYEEVLTIKRICVFLLYLKKAIFANSTLHIYLKPLKFYNCENRKKAEYLKEVCKKIKKELLEGNKS